MDYTHGAFERMMMTREQRVEETIQRIEKLVERIGVRIARIEHRLDDIQGSATRMDTHIHFFSRIYHSLRSTLVERFGIAPAIEDSSAIRAVAL